MDHSRLSTVLLLDLAAHLDPLGHGASVSLHHLVTHLIQLVPHLRGATSDLAARDEGRGLGGFGNSVLSSKFILR